jgi:hypothetical protein
MPNQRLARRDLHLTLKHQCTSLAVVAAGIRWVDCANHMQNKSVRTRHWPRVGFERKATSTGTGEPYSCDWGVIIFWQPSEPPQRNRLATN